MGLRLPEGLRSGRRLERRPRLAGVPGVGMVLNIGGGPEATCECGNRSFGDSINDAVLAWTKHVTSTPACREKL